MSPVNHREKGRPQHRLRSSFHAENRAEKRGFSLLLAELKRLAPAVCAVLLYAAVTQLLFDRFCPMLILTGLPCPGCGMTRALFLALTGRFARAWEFQPPVYGWILLGLAFAVRRYLTVSPVSAREKQLWTLALALLLLASLVLYIYRMFTGFPEGIVEPGRTLVDKVWVKI